MSTKKISEIESKATSAEIGGAKLVAAIPSGDGHVTKYIEGNDLAYSMSPGMTIMEIKTIDDTNIATFSGTSFNFANWEPGDVFYVSDNHGWKEVPANTSYVTTANTRIQVYPVSDNGNFTLKRSGNVGLVWGRNYIHLRNSAGIVSGGTGGGSLGGIFADKGCICMNVPTAQYTAAYQCWLSAPSGIKWLASAQGVDRGYSMSNTPQYGVYENITSENLLIVNSNTGDTEDDTPDSVPVTHWNGAVQIDVFGGTGNASYAGNFSNDHFFVAAPGGKFALLGESNGVFRDKPFQVLRSWGGYTATEWRDAGAEGISIDYPPDWKIIASIAGPDGKLNS